MVEIAVDNAWLLALMLFGTLHVVVVEERQKKRLSPHFLK